ncbi:PQQ-dependent sugar dehydrogenase [Rhodovulum sp. DZ06]|uniref:PQQ-dependent sugar dehydrogenase n=1 Tax=Rhodovulum sp. DZ06 TaxID=3425126 RepID=UPI003D352131
MPRPFPRRRAAAFALGLAALAPALLSALAPAPAAAQEGVEELLSGLSYPWDVARHGDAIYITEKDGTLGILSGGAFTRRPVRSAVPILSHRGGGLMGLALTPDFETSGRVILYHHAGTPDSRFNRVIEAERRGDEWVETRELVARIPGHPLYNGGRVAFGPDGMLYVATGWTERRAAPRDLSDLAGKILRLTPDGGVPADNPFPGSPVWSLGHRNPQGIAWDGAGVMYAAEHGQSGHDEVNRIEKGGDYGWPEIQGDDARGDMRAPLAHSGGSTWAPSGLAWDGDRLLVAGLRAQGLLEVTPGGDVTRIPLGARIRDVDAAGDGILVITTQRSPRREGPSRDRLLRLERR